LPGADPAGLQLTDFDAVGVPDLRTVSADGRATTYRIMTPGNGPVEIRTGAVQALA
jgi:hypothetical protein